MNIIEKNILNGDINIIPQFLDNKEFDNLKDNIQKLEYTPTYQPRFTYFGNRFQAYPCYENLDQSISNFLEKKIAKIFGRKLKDFNIIIRKTLSEELKKSKVNTAYGLTHSDDKQFASILHFDQTVSGGTVFFEHLYDKYPDITIGAFPNRLLMYNGRRFHAPAHDFTFEERYIIGTFWN